MLASCAGAGSLRRDHLGDLNSIECCVQGQGMVRQEFRSLGPIVMQVQIIEEVISLSVVERRSIAHLVLKIAVIDESRVRADCQDFDEYDERLSVLL